MSASDSDTLAATPEKIDQKLLNRVGRALWRAENIESLKDVSFEDRHALWAEAKKPYLARSRQLLRSLRNEGIEFRFKEDGEA